MHGALIDAEILSPPRPHVFAQPGQDLGTDTLPVGVQLPPKSSENVPMCLNNLQKNLVHEALIDAVILTSPLPYVFAQLDPIMRYQCFTCGCANTSQVV